MSSFGNRQRVLKGAFVEYGLSLAPLAVRFQFNPVQLQRSRSVDFRAPNAVFHTPQPGAYAAPEGADTERWEKPRELREWHAETEDLDDIWEQQIVSVGEETIHFTLQLDATDALNDGEAIATAFGVGPALSTLELMTYPKGEGVILEALGGLLGEKKGYQYDGQNNPPMVLFIWGMTRVLPVNITSLAVTETEFDALLNPIRASVDVSMTVIEGKNPIATFSTVAKEAMSLLNAVQVISEITIPG